MKYIVAVSGGVDSVVLLDMLVHGRLEIGTRQNPSEIVVAHFEHGIRGEVSKADARFVEALSQKYRLKYEIGYGNLTKSTSEATAREKRYEFLQKVAKKYGGKIVTAHHADDLIETVAINLVRGTGWRGLAVFGDKNITRPLLSKTKIELYDYALKEGLEWVEDETNQTDQYLRNRIRRLVFRLSDKTKQRLCDYWTMQSKLASSIDQAASDFTEVELRHRYFFIMIPDKVAIELLRSITAAKLTRPQLSSALLAIKTYRAGQIFEAGAGIQFEFTSNHFIVKNSSPVL